MSVTEDGSRATIERHLSSVPIEDLPSSEGVFSFAGYNKRTEMYSAQVEVGEEGSTDVRVTIEALSGDLDGSKNIVLIRPGFIASEGLYLKLRGALAESGIPTASVRDKTQRFFGKGTFDRVRHPERTHVDTGVAAARAISAYTGAQVVGAGHSEGGFSVAESAKIDPTAFAGVILLSAVGLEEFVNVEAINRVVGPLVLASRLPRLLGRDVGRSLASGDIEVTLGLTIEELKRIANIGVMGVQLFSLSQAKIHKTVSENRENGVKVGAIQFDEDAAFCAGRVERRVAAMFDDFVVTSGLRLDHLAPINRPHLVSALIHRMMARMDLLEPAKPAMTVVPSTIS